MKNSNHKLFFLLDEGLPPRKKLPRMNKRSSFNIRHITHDYKQSGLTDSQVLKRAEKENRILVVIDLDFNKRRLIQKKTAILKIIGGLVPIEIDELFLKVVNKFKNKEDYFGKIIRVSQKWMEVDDGFSASKRVKYEE